MRANTIESALVAACLASQFAFGPMTDFHCGMLTDYSIMLFLVYLLILGKHRLVITLII